MEMKSSETIAFTGRVGKPANAITYTHVVYYDKEYTVMKIKTNDKYVFSVIDTEDYVKIKDYSWHYIANSYISHTIQVDDKRKELYLHNLVMGRVGFPGKGATESVDHVSRNGLDNRKENLRLITQSAQNINQKRKERRIELPANAGITLDDIPKHIWYIKANGSHGERFGIDLKTENIKWKTTSAKNVSLQDKLKSAKEQLELYYQQYPYLNPNNEENAKEIWHLNTTYEDIIQLASNDSKNTSALDHFRARMNMPIGTSSVGIPNTPEDMALIERLAKEYHV